MTSKDAVDSVPAGDETGVAAPGAARSEALVTIQRVASARTKCCPRLELIRPIPSRCCSTPAAACARVRGSTLAEEMLRMQQIRRVEDCVAKIQDQGLALSSHLGSGGHRRGSI